jgi:hypothetical protein
LGEDCETERYHVITSYCTNSYRLLRSRCVAVHKPPPLSKVNWSLFRLFLVIRPGVCHSFLSAIMTNGWSSVRQQVWESLATSAAFMHLCLCTSVGCSGSPHWPYSPQSLLPCPTHDVSPSMRLVPSLAAVVASIHHPCGSSEDLALRRDSSITRQGLWPSHQLCSWP